MIKESIIAKASRCIDEVYPSPNDINAPFLPVEVFIGEAAECVIKLVPAHLLGPGTRIEINDAEISEGKGAWTLPTTFRRLISFKCKNWARPVLIPIYDTDASYVQQANPYMRGTAQRPVVALCEGESVLEFYPAVEGATAAMRYFGFDPQDDSLWDNIPEKLVPIIAWKTAEAVLTSISSYTAAQACQAKVNELIQAL